MRNWKQSEVLRAEEWLNFIPESHQGTAVAMANEEWPPPKMVAKVLAILVNVPSEKRAEIFELYERDNEDDRRAAWALARRHSHRDPRIQVIEEALYAIRVAAKYEPDTHTSGIKVLEAAANAALAELEKVRA